MPKVNLEKHGEIHYLERGDSDKEKIILLHGLGNQSKTWEEQLNMLSKNYHVIAWDAPGYGGSYDPYPWIHHFEEFSKILNQFCEALNFKKIFLVGHSMGAAIAIDFAYRFPEKVKKLIIADPTRGGAFKDEENNQKSLENRLYAINEEGSVKLAQDRTKNLFSDNASRTLIAKSEKIMQQVRPSGYSSVSYSLYNLNQKNIYPKIEVSTLIICGEEDKITPVAESDYIHQQIPYSKLSIIPKAGHLCFLEDPEGFQYRIINFLMNS